MNLSVFWEKMNFPRVNTLSQANWPRRGRSVLVGFGPTGVLIGSYAAAAAAAAVYFRRRASLSHGGDCRTAAATAAAAPSDSDGTTSNIRDFHLLISFRRGYSVRFQGPDDYNASVHSEIMHAGC